MNTHALRASLLALALGCSSTPATNTADAGSAPADVVAAADVPRVDAPAVTDRGPTLDTPAAQDAANPCTGLGALCHEVDPGSGPIHDCHEGGHDGDPAWCAANGARCRAVCLAEGTRLCQGLGALCHDVDPGSGPIHDCHEGGHDGDPLWCTENALRCRALCTPDASVGDASADAAQRD